MTSWCISVDGCGITEKADYLSHSILSTHDDTFNKYAKKTLMEVTYCSFKQTVEYDDNVQIGNDFLGRALRSGCSRGGFPAHLLTNQEHFEKD